MRNPGSATTIVQPNNMTREFRTDRMGNTNLKTPNKSLREKSVMATVVICAILPSLSVGGFRTPVLYLPLPLLLLFTLMMAGSIDRVKMPRNLRNFTFLWSLIIVEVLLSGVFGAPMQGYSSRFPVEVIQYIARATYFTAFALWSYRGELGARQLLVSFHIIMLFAMTLGLLQYVPWGGEGVLAKAYTYTERYVETSTRQSLLAKRVPGMAGHPTSNGGLAAFAFVIGIRSLLFNKRRMVVSGTLALLAIMNTVFSHARMGYLTIFAVMPVFYVMWSHITGRHLRVGCKFLGVVTAIGGVLIALYRYEQPWIMRAYQRWHALADQIAVGGNRIGQVQVISEHLTGMYTYLFGISRVAQSAIGVFHVEVEPFNILMLYGVLGFMLQYGLVVGLLIYFARRVRCFRHQPALGAAVLISFVALFGYQIFSLAYFFFRETAVGALPWIFMGATVGLIERQRRIKDIEREYGRPSPLDT